MEVRDLVLYQASKESENFLLTAVIKKGFKIPQGQGEDSLKMVNAEIKAFGGNPSKFEDQERASVRVLKFINLGLESNSKAEMQTGKEISGTFDAKKAERIIGQVPLIKLYLAGKKYFAKSSGPALEFLKETAVEIDGLHFHLISASDDEKIRGVADIEHSKGTVREHSEAQKLTIKILKLLPLAQFFPINKTGLPIFERFGSKSEADFPNEKGLLEMFLLSLIVTCMFRSENDLFFSSGDMQNIDVTIRIIKSLKKDLLAKKGASEEEITTAINASRNFRRVIEKDLRDRRNAKGESNWEIFARLFAISPSEARKFADLLFSEPERFAKEEADKIKALFYKYFSMTEELLGIKTPPDIDIGRRIDDAFSFVAERITEEVANFYKTVKDADFSNEEVAKFWHQRIFLKAKDETEGISLKSKDSVEPAKLVELSLDYIIDATKFFLQWPPEKQKLFMEKMHMPRFIHEVKEDPEMLLKFLQNIEQKNDGEKTAVEARELIAYQEDSDWVRKAINKINWESASPHVISYLWEKGSDRVRDNLFEKRSQFKVTLPAIKNYYLFRHQDLRLLEYALSEAVRKDVVRTERVWKELLELSENMGAVKTVIELKRKETKK